MDRYKKHLASCTTKTALIALLFMLKLDRTLSHSEYYEVLALIVSKKETL